MGYITEIVTILLQVELLLTMLRRKQNFLKSGIEMAERVGKNLKLAEKGGKLCGTF